MPTSADQIDRFLQYFHQLFEEHEIWHCLAFGTLLGAVRDQDIIPWDYDVDMIIRPEDGPRLLALNEVVAEQGFEFVNAVAGGRTLALNPHKIRSYKTQKIHGMYGGRRIADFYTYTCFSDGVMRRFDFDQDVYWCPHYSFPAYFMETIADVTIRDRHYPGLGCAEVFLTGIYGADWRTPYQAAVQGGTMRPGVTIHAARYEPRLFNQLEWCRRQGWDSTKYSDAPKWPSTIRGGGPIGPTKRTQDNSRALWWRDFEELTEHY